MPVSMLTRVLRWVLVVPGSVIALLVAYNIVKLGNFITWPSQVDLLSRIFIEGSAHAVAGGALVLAAARIAPTHRRTVAVTACAITLVFGGALLFASVLTRNWWAVFGGICLMSGAAAVGLNRDTLLEIDASDR